MSNYYSGKAGLRDYLLGDFNYASRGVMGVTNSSGGYGASSSRVVPRFFRLGDLDGFFYSGRGMDVGIGTGWGRGCDGSCLRVYAMANRTIVFGAGSSNAYDARDYACKIGRQRAASRGGRSLSRYRCRVGEVRGFND